MCSELYRRLVTVRENSGKFLLQEWSWILEFGIMGESFHSSFSKRLCFSSSQIYLPRSHKRTLTPYIWLNFLSRVKVYCPESKFTVMSTHSGASFIWLMKHTYGVLRSTASSAIHIRQENLCWTLPKTTTRWFSVNVSDYIVAHHIHARQIVTQANHDWRQGQQFNSLSCTVAGCQGVHRRMPESLAYFTRGFQYR